MSSEVVQSLEEKYAHIKDDVTRVMFKNATMMYGKCDPPDPECELHLFCMEMQGA